MFDALSDRLEGILGRLRSRGRLSDADVDEALREIRTACSRPTSTVAWPGRSWPGSAPGSSARTCPRA